MLNAADQTIALSDRNFANAYLDAAYAIVHAATDDTAVFAYSAMMIDA